MLNIRTSAAKAPLLLTDNAGHMVAPIDLLHMVLAVWALRYLLAFLPLLVDS